VHGDREPSLREVAQRFELLADTLRVHLAEEETELFPALLDGRDVEATPMLLDMRREHEQVGTLLGELRQAARDFRPPEWACTSYRTLLSELAALEADVLEHVHIENHVLLPRYVRAGAA
jgi:regulator of cell morphogenesis and NO signaling